MEKLLVRGGARLRGAARVSGAKNAVLPVLAAAVLTPEPCVVLGAPRLRDVEVMTEILRCLGVEVSTAEDPQGAGRALRVRAGSLRDCAVPDELMREMRSSIFLMGPLLARVGRVRMSHPGGCAIGPRPIDYHLRGLEKMGARIVERHGYIHAETQGLRGGDIHLDFPSVGATENLMMAAVLASGHTVVRNVAREPEIVDLQNFLNAMGARVRGAGTHTVRVEGVEGLRGARHRVIPDRIEASTLMIATVATRGDVRLENVIPEHLEAVTAKLGEVGAVVEEVPGGLRVAGVRRPRAVDLKTLPYPGLATDVQPQMMALMCSAEGTSVITETVFENRFSQAEELRRMGADILVEGRTAVVRGVPGLTGATLEATDLRNCAALIIAGLAAEGVTVVERVEHLDRGYQDFELKLRRLGASLCRVRGVGG